MKICEDVSEPVNVSLNNQPPRTMKQRLVTYMIDSEKDIKELQAELIKGRDIFLQFEAGGNTYIILRDFLPSKIALVDK